MDELFNNDGHMMHSHNKVNMHGRILSMMQLKCMSLLQIYQEFPFLLLEPCNGNKCVDYNSGCVNLIFSPHIADGIN